MILLFTCDFFAYFQFHSDRGWVIGKIKQNELNCHDTAPSIDFLLNYNLHNVIIFEQTTKKIKNEQNLRDLVWPCTVTDNVIFVK